MKSLDNFKVIKDEVYKLQSKSNLIVVTKNQTLNSILPIIESGHIHFGENRVQEASLKWKNLISNPNLKLHLIGKLQSNKVKDAFEIFQERFESEYELVMYFKEHPNVYASINIFNAIMCISYGVSVSQLRAVYKDIDLDYKKFNTKIFKATIKIGKYQAGNFKIDKESGKRQYNPF